MAQPVYDALTPDTVLFGEGLYREAIDHVIGLAQRELRIFDHDLGLGDYASLRRCAQLQDFLSRSPGNRLTIVLHDTARFAQQYPRLFGLLKTYGHAMCIYETNDQAKVARDSFIVADRQHYLRRFHIDQPRFRYATDDPETAQMLCQRFDELLEATSHTVATHSLGL